MTCFWTGILKQLNKLDNDLINQVFGVKPINVSHLNELIKKISGDENTNTNQVIWQKENISSQMMKENKERIASIDVKQINHGYLCSSCDPVLILLCQLMKMDIDHKFCNVLVKYEYIGNDKRSELMQFYSNRGHFWN